MDLSILEASSRVLHTLSPASRLRAPSSFIGGSEPAIQNLHPAGVKVIQGISLGWNEIFERGVVAISMWVIFLGHWLESPILAGVAMSEIILLRKKRLGLRRRA